MMVGIGRSVAAQLHRRFALAAGAAGDDAETKRHFEAERRLLEDLAGPDSLEVAILLVNYGQYATRWDLDGGLAMLRRAAEILDHLKDPRIAIARGALALILANHERWREARPILEDILAAADPDRIPAVNLGQMRYHLAHALYETKGDKIPLAKEMEYIAKYIALQKIRTANENYVHFTVESDSGKISGNETMGYSVSDLNRGFHTANLIAEDCCGNISSKQVVIRVIDNFPPNAVCDQNLVVSITGNQAPGNNFAKIFANGIDQGSFDNCEPVFFKIIRSDNLSGTKNGSELDQLTGSIDCYKFNGNDKPNPNGNQIKFDDFICFIYHNLANKFCLNNFF